MCLAPSGLVAPSRHLLFSGDHVCIGILFVFGHLVSVNQEAAKMAMSMFIQTP